MTILIGITLGISLISGILMFIRTKYIQKNVIDCFIVLQNDNRLIINGLLKIIENQHILAEIVDQIENQKSDKDLLN